MRRMSSVFALSSLSSFSLAAAIAEEAAFPRSSR